MLLFLQENYLKKTNDELAAELGLRKTVTRNKLRELGLKRMELEYWNEEQVQYLRDNYKTIGDVEIMEHFIQKYPKQKGWKRGAIMKKRSQMALLRTEEEKAAIVAKHVRPGGRSYTIDKNSSSKNMHPSWVAAQIAWRDPLLKKEIIETRPDLIETFRGLIKLKRLIKEKKNVCE
jgi:hypothetical protein